MERHSGAEFLCYFVLLMTILHCGSSSLKYAGIAIAN